MAVVLCTCEGCQNSTFRLHIGDRVVFSGGIPGRYMHELKYLGENAGLRIQGTVGAETILVVTDDSDENSSTVQKATLRNIKVVSPDQFKIQIQKMQQNGRIKKVLQEKSFEALNLNGGKVFPIDLDIAELEKLERILKIRGASLAQQLRPSITAGVFNEKSSQNGKCKILISEAIPVYNISDL